MKILVNLENTDDFREYEIDDQEPLQNLKYIIEAELNIPVKDQQIRYDGKLLIDDRLNLKQCNLKDNEIITVSRIRLGENLSDILNNMSSKNGQNNQSNLNQNKSLSSIFDNTMKILNKNPGNSGIGNFFNFDQQVKNESLKLKETFLNNPDELSLLFTTDPELAEILVSEDEKRLEDILNKRITNHQNKKKKEQEDYFKLMNSDPNDLEAQKKIEEIIRMKNVDENYKMAQEYLPETFLQVHMLYINLEINKNKIVGLVDTGAQTTIISEDLAKKCGVYSLIDTRCSGIAKGVGTSKILGVVHAAQLKLADK